MTHGLLDARARFERSLVAAGAGRTHDALFGELASRYGEPARRYHTLAHVGACLTWLERFSRCATRAPEVELALWFHDVVYDPRRGDNERLSAALARARLRALGVPLAALDRIARHIEATQCHDAADGDSALVNDLDLTILGAKPPVFDRFERQIRVEYAHVPEVVYRPARRRVLDSFRTRPAIYRVPALREELEAAARDNLERRISELATC